MNLHGLSRKYTKYPKDLKISFGILKVPCSFPLIKLLYHLQEGALYHRHTISSSSNDFYNTTTARSEEVAITCSHQTSPDMHGNEILIYLII